MLTNRAIILLVLILLSCTGAHAQTSTSGEQLLSVDLRVNPVVSDAQALSLATLGINTTGRGLELFEIIIINTSGRELSDLYLRIEVSASRFGKIAEVFSANQNSFVLRPGQVIIANNNNLDNGLSGIPAQTLTARLTTQGENLLRSLDGSPVLPDDIYTTTVYIMEGSADLSIGRILASTSDIVGARPIQNVVDFELLQPGGPVGSGDIVSVLNPTFRWDGPIDQDYRIIIVEDIGQSPLSLLQSARSTDPVLGAGATGSRLLEFEMVDALVSGTSWQYPVSGVRSLQPGKRYFWQIYARIRTATGFEERPSAIFEFSLPSAQGEVASSQVVEEAIPVVRSISPGFSAQLLALIEQGYQITSVEVDGVRYSGLAMIAILEDFANGVQTGTIKLVDP